VSAESVIPRSVHVGAGAIAELPRLAGGFGRRGLLVSGRSSERARRATELLARHSIETTPVSVAHEPSVDDVARLLDVARAAAVEFVVAIGGGSVLDAGKAVAGLLANPGELHDYLEVVGQAKPLERPALPFIAIPTTAGTGSEATRNAVLDVPGQHVKVSIRSPHLVPAAVILDPELTLSLPGAQTLASGLDALTQLLEAFVCRRANALSDAVCREGLRRAIAALPRAVADGTDLAARADMQTAAFFSGIALANAGLGAVHGFTGPLGGLLRAPHGALCAALLGPVVEANIAALCARAPGAEALRRYAEVAAMATGRRDADAGDCVAWLREFLTRLSVPSLRDFGFGPQLIPTAVAMARAATSMKANPIDLTDAELEQVLLKAMGDKPGGGQ